jgi:hypothetical protein
MDETNRLVIDLLNILTAFLPLLPLGIVLLRRSWYYEPLSILLVICLIFFASGILTLFLGNHPAEQYILSNVSALMEFCLLLFFFRSVMHNRLIDYLLVTLLAAYLVGSITYCIARGFPENSTLFFVSAKAILLGFGIFYVFSILQQTDAHILDSPVFWITVGICFHACIFILVSLLSYFSPQSTNLQFDKVLLLDMLRIIQLLFFSFGAWIYKNPVKY